LRGGGCVEMGWLWTQRLTGRKGSRGELSAVRSDEIFKGIDCPMANLPALECGCTGSLAVERLAGDPEFKPKGTTCVHPW
jgi:hypothetical protein